MSELGTASAMTLVISACAAGILLLADVSAVTCCLLRHVGLGSFPASRQRLTARCHHYHLDSQYKTPSYPFIQSSNIYIVKTMSDRQSSETTPLLERNASSPADSATFKRRQLAFRVATVVSFVTSILTVISVVVCMWQLSKAPSNYYAPWEMSNTFAPVAGFVSVFVAHSISALTSV